MSRYLFIFCITLNLSHLLFALTYRPYGSGYSPVQPDSLYHADERGMYNNGSCREFLERNSLNYCCENREDNCYMVHFDTRCYCDRFCIREHSDCCPDAIEVCEGRPTAPPTRPPPPPTRPPPPPTRPPPPATRGCWHYDSLYAEGDVVQDNCNICECRGEQWDCTDEKCLVDVKLLDEINKNRLSWKANNYSKFWGKPLNYGYRHKLGTRLPAHKQRPFDANTQYTTEQLSILIPNEYDFREDPLVQDKLRKRPIRDQGECGASWAFSTIDVATDRFVRVSKGKHGNQTSYSVQQLISCAILQDNQDGCTPSGVHIAWNFINHVNPESGVVEESCQPYANGARSSALECSISRDSIAKKNVVCRDSVTNAARRYNESILLASPVYPLRVTTEEDIMREILLQGPVQAVFRVYQDFFMYGSGVYEWSGLAEPYNHRDPYHSVKILGWGTENGVDYWLCANSWGEDWGDNGYFKIKRGDKSEINDHIYAAWGNGKVNGKLVNNNMAMLNKFFQSRSQI